MIKVHSGNDDNIGTGNIFVLTLTIYDSKHLILVVMSKNRIAFFCMQFS